MCGKNFRAKNCYNGTCGSCCIYANDFCTYHGKKLWREIESIREMEYHKISIKNIFETIYQSNWNESQYFPKDIVNLIIQYVIDRKKYDNCKTSFHCRESSFHKNKIICFKCGIPMCDACARII